MSEVMAVEEPVATEDPETRLRDDHHESLRLWLRLLTCTLMVERRIKSRLRNQFAMTLPRFDLMAQLERSRDGLKMSELSRRLMVSGGNVTSLTDQLVGEGLVERLAVPGDRRAQRIRLTDAGRVNFLAMASEHEGWIIEMLAGLSPGDRATFHELLGRLKASLALQGE